MVSQFVMAHICSVLYFDSVEECVRLLMVIHAQGHILGMGVTSMGSSVDLSWCLVNIGFSFVFLLVVLLFFSVSCRGSLWVTNALS